MMRKLVPFLLLFAGLLYAWMASGPWAAKVWNVRHARDFASFYYAVQVAADGGDPYDTAALGRLASQDSTRHSVHPFFYPPPFVLSFLWVRPLDLSSAWRLWYVANHLWLLVVLLSLWRWVPRPATALVLAGMAVTFTPISDNDIMGQVNLLVLAVAVLGLLLAQKGWEKTGGALVGLACMLKMSPALLVAWWLLQRRWRPVAAACGTALLLSVLALPWVGFAEQQRFFTEVLPGFGSGDYHGLTVAIDLKNNHSIPSLLHTFFPGGKTSLSPTARHLSQVIALALVGGLAWAFRRPVRDSLSALCQVGTVTVVMLVLPVYTYEHHMVWLLVPYAAAAAAVVEGRLGRRWLVALVVAWAIQAFPLQTLNEIYVELRVLGAWEEPAYRILREFKFVTALFVGVACAVASRRGEPAGTQPC